MSIWPIRFDPPESCRELTGDCQQRFWLDNGENGCTLLMEAASSGRVEALQFLINCKASLDIKGYAILYGRVVEHA